MKALILLLFLLCLNARAQGFYITETETLSRTYVQDIELSIQQIKTNKPSINKHEAIRIAVAAGHAADVGDLFLLDDVEL